MDEVARRAGVSKPVVYFHFGSKDELYERTLEHATGRLGLLVSERAAGEQTPEARLWAGIQAFLESAEKRSVWWELVLEATDYGGDFADAVQAARNAMAGYAFELFADAVGAPAGRSTHALLEMCAHSFVGSCLAATRWWQSHPEVSREEMAFALMNLAWRGFGGPLEGNVWVPPDPAR
jgi:AcrR family transcriptional regulator